VKLFAIPLNDLAASDAGQSVAIASRFDTPSEIEADAGPHRWLLSSKKNQPICSSRTIISHPPASDRRMRISGTIISFSSENENRA
jgi:hypothetical protein